MLDVEQWLKKVNIDVKTFTKRTAFELWNEVTLLTPVDTGRCRASWMLVDGKQANLSVAPESASVPAPSAPNVPAANAYVISNNLPYAQALENGHSKQAPAGMMKLAIATIKTRLQITLGKV